MTNVKIINVCFLCDTYVDSIDVANPDSPYIEEKLIGLGIEQIKEVYPTVSTHSYETDIGISNPLCKECIEKQ